MIAGIAIYRSLIITAPVYPRVDCIPMCILPGDTVPYTVEPGYNESYGTRENIPYNQVLNEIRYSQPDTQK